MSMSCDFSYKRSAKNTAGTIFQELNTTHSYRAEMPDRLVNKVKSQQEKKIMPVQPLLFSSISGSDLSPVAISTIALARLCIGR